MSESGGLGSSRKVKWNRVMQSKLDHVEKLALTAKREEEKKDGGKKKKVRKVLTE